MVTFVIDGFKTQSWDRTCMGVAAEIAKRATCPRASVGAVLVQDTVPISWGYNGAPRRQPHCKDVGCDLQVLHGRESCQRAVHAEMNAILNAARDGRATVGATLYCTHAPCLRCADAIIQAGVTRVCYGTLYGRDGVTRLQNSGVRVEPTALPE